MWYAKCKLLPSNQQTFFIESYITDFKSYIIQYKQKLHLHFNTRQIKFLNLKKRFVQFRRKIIGYADMFMMYSNCLCTVISRNIQGHIII